MAIGAKASFAHDIDISTVISLAIPMLILRVSGLVANYIFKSADGLAVYSKYTLYIGVIISNIMIWLSMTGGRDHHIHLTPNENVNDCKSDSHSADHSMLQTMCPTSFHAHEFSKIEVHIFKAKNNNETHSIYILWTPSISSKVE